MMMAGQRQEAEAVISLPMGQASTLKMERNFLFYCIGWLLNFWGSFVWLCVCECVGSLPCSSSYSKEGKKTRPYITRESSSLFLEARTIITFYSSSEKKNRVNECIEPFIALKSFTNKKPPINNVIMQWCKKSAALGSIKLSFVLFGSFGFLSHEMMKMMMMIIVVFFSIAHIILRFYIQVQLKKNKAGG